MTTPGPFSKPPATPTPIAHRAIPKRIEPPSVLNSDISGPILTILAPILTVVSPVLRRVGRLKRWQARLLGVTVAFVALVVVANIAYEPGTIAHARDQAGALIVACGSPSADDSTAYDNPRPPIPTRIMDYWGTHIRFFFVPRGKFGQAPPYDWELVAIMDVPDWADTEKSPKPITHEEVHRRMSCMRFPS